MTEKFARYPSLHGRVVFVTGGASGIGAEEVSSFAAQGARVGFVDIDDAAAAALIERIADAGHPTPHYVHCDVRDIPALLANLVSLRSLALHKLRTTAASSGYVLSPGSVMVCLGQMSAQMSQMTTANVQSDTALCGHGICANHTRLP